MKASTEASKEASTGATEATTATTATATTPPPTPTSEDAGTIWEVWCPVLEDRDFLNLVEKIAI